MSGLYQKLFKWLFKHAQEDAQEDCTRIIYSMPLVGISLAEKTIEALRSLARTVLRALLQFYPRERGKYSILQRLYFPYFAPRLAEHMLPQTVKMRAGMKMTLMPTELLQAHLYLFGTYELPTTRFMMRFLRNGDTVIDVGANIGYISLLCARCVGKHGRVLALEPETRNFEALKEHIALNCFDNTILPIQAAATAEETMLTLYLAHDNNGAHSTVVHHDSVGTAVEKIQGKPLDAIIADAGIEPESIALVKIDVEGAEYDVLQGMKKILALPHSQSEVLSDQSEVLVVESLKHKRRPVLIVELNHETQQAAGHSVNEVIATLTQRWCYELFLTNEHGWLSKPTGDTGFENGVFIPSERLHEVQSLLLH